MEEKSLTASVLTARAAIAELTPLREDCGRLCGAACCRSLPGEETGMALYPGERALCEGVPGFSLRETAWGTLLVCGGQCDRETRPLACRVFPLVPLWRDGAIRVAVDAGAKAVCPLRRLSACREDFVEAVRRAGQEIARTEAGVDWLQKLTAQQDELRALRGSAGG